MLECRRILKHDNLTLLCKSNKIDNSSKKVLFFITVQNVTATTTNIRILATFNNIDNWDYKMSYNGYMYACIHYIMTCIYGHNNIHQWTGATTTIIHLLEWINLSSNNNDDNIMANNDFVKMLLEIDPFAVVKYG